MIAFRWIDTILRYFIYLFRTVSTVRYVEALKPTVYVWWWLLGSVSLCGVGYGPILTLYLDALERENERRKGGVKGHSNNVGMIKLIIAFNGGKWIALRRLTAAFAPTDPSRETSSTSKNWHHD